MKVVVVGGGKVGQLLTQLLVEEDHDVVAIDNREDILELIQTNYDVAVVHGNGATVEVQTEAGVGESDLLIAATSSDEVNLLCCVVANMLGATHTVARVRNPEYDHQIEFLRQKLGMDIALNPEKATAREVFRMLQYPSFLKRDSFAQGRVELVEIKIPDDSALVGKKLMESKDILRVNALICVVDRDGDVFIPDGHFVLQAGDRIMVAAEGAKLINLMRSLKLTKKPIRDVMVVGGGHISRYLAQLLEKSRVNVTIIEQDRAKCEELSTELPKATIIHGNGTDQELLLSEGIRDMDAVITLTGMDEENMIISMFANSLDVPKTVTKINRTEYINVLTKAGIDTTVSPKLLVANEIMRYVRTIYHDESELYCSLSGKVETLYRLANGKAEALGFTVPVDGNYLGKTLMELKLKPNVLIASIIRNYEVIIPKGSDCLMPGDSIVVVTTSDQAIIKLSDIFASEI
ncbi:MAG: Trk system potassium transporter TrkA [Oscillospiraceae bacterium]|nr:Trk system potassium transporter TrkA [Oscillospiraceae bacterium]